MEHQQHEQDDDVYGGDLPDEDYMESEFDHSADADAEPDADAEAASESKTQELESMKKRLQEIEEEAGALREMQAKVEKEMGANQGFVEIRSHFKFVYNLGSIILCCYFGSLSNA
ncbi:hypothetical protein SASPL_123417 [Salvia splendens]|uniref:Polyadenylate-binding protein 2 n=1 Tax=Salvia splendens TaxID=180675 RepID=A0A8X8XR58_SALSN|nr:hypothetical protein SASPL_123417 [Salvia splendens]